MVGAPTADLAGLWPLFGLLFETPRLRLRLPREDSFPPSRGPHATSPAQTASPNTSTASTAPPGQLTQQCTAPPAEETA